MTVKALAAGCLFVAWLCYVTGQNVILSRLFSLSMFSMLLISLYRWRHRQAGSVLHFLIGDLWARCAL
jgi:hypothetical protein